MGKNEIFQGVDWLVYWWLNVTVNDISVICVPEHRLKKVDFRLGFHVIYILFEVLVIGPVFSHPTTRTFYGTKGFEHTT